MGTILFYIFKSTLCLIILYILFRLLFRKDTLFRTNRWLLLIGTTACIFLPLLQIDVSQYTPLQLPITTVERFLTEKEVNGKKVEAIGKEHPIAEVSISVAEKNITREYRRRVIPAIPVILVLGSCYLVGVFVVFTSLLLSTIRMRRLIGRFPSTDCGKYKLVICPEKIVSFSWGNTIVLSQEDYEKNPGEILLHEQMHLQHRHTLDLFWMECLVILHWFNPAAWLLIRELREVHEYEADNGVINHGIDATKYQLLLVKKSVGTRLYSMACGFNHSKLKNRITMMLKRRTNRWARLKLLLFVPVAAGALYAFAQPEVKKTVEQVMAPLSVKQDSLCRDEVELLEQYFQRKRSEYLSKYAIKESKKATHSLFVNLKDQTMLDNEWLKSSDWDKNAEFLRTLLTNTLREDYRKAMQNKKLFQPVLLVRYDRGSKSGAVRYYLNTVKEVYQQLREEVAAEQAFTDEAQLDKAFPVLVEIVDPKTYGGKVVPKAGAEILPIEISLYKSDITNARTFKNMSLTELEKEIRAYTADDSDHYTVCLKADHNTNMGTVMDVKNMLRRILVVK